MLVTHIKAFGRFTVVDILLPALCIAIPLEKTDFVGGHITTDTNCGEVYGGDLDPVLASGLYMELRLDHLTNNQSPCEYLTQSRNGDVDDDLITVIEFQLFEVCHNNAKDTGIKCFFL